MDSDCPICGFALVNDTNHTATFDSIFCSLCGNYRIYPSGRAELKKANLTPHQKSKIIGFITENQNIELKGEIIIKLKDLPDLSVVEKADRILQRLSNLFPRPGQNISAFKHSLKFNFINRGIYYNDRTNKDNFDVRNYFSVYAISRSENMEEFNFLFYDYLITEKRYIESTNATPTGTSKITPTGWSYLDSLRHKNLESKIAFIAMRFTDPLKNFCDYYIEKGIKSAGYEPLRIDKHQHNNLIDDEIIAGLRRSKFVVADFTDNSYGAYYEAGYARGFNLPVIYLCNEDFFKEEKTKPHFDVNHYSMILWNFDKGDELVEKLKNKIEATIGRGPINS